MSKKLFAFDMDGTILPHGDHVLPATVEAVKEAKNKGHVMCIATGRPYLDIIRVGEDIAHTFDYLICNNGSYIFDVKNKKYLTETLVPANIAKDVLEFSKTNEVLFAMHAIEGSYRYMDKNNGADWAKEILSDEWYRFGFNELSEIEEVIDNLTITQVSLRGTKEVIEAIKPIFAKYNSQVEIHIAGEIYLDLNPKGASKWEGIKKVCALEGIDLENTIAVGDSGNDVQMLKGAALGIAMGNATEEAKKVAKEVIGDSHTEAIAQKIRELI